MNTKQLKYAMVLAETKSFSKAASQLNISQPSLSQYVKKIETEVGVPLFERTGGYVKLTDAGKFYIQAGKKMLSIEKDLENQLLDVKQEKVGTLTVGMSHFRTNDILKEIAQPFKRLYPNVNLVIDERTLSQVIEGAEHGEFDLAIIPHPVDLSVFNTHKVMDEELTLALPTAWVKDLCPTTEKDRRYPVIDIKELDGKQFIVGESNQTVQTALDRLLEENGVTIKPQITVKRLEVQLELVKMGLGAALIPTGAKKQSDQKVTYLSLKQNLAKRDIYAVYRKDSYLPKIANDFIALLQKTFL